MMKVVGSSAPFPSVVLLLAFVACGDAGSRRASAPNGIATSEAPAPVASESANPVFEIQTAHSSVSYGVDEEFLAGALDRLGIDAGPSRTTGVSEDVSGTLELEFEDAGVTVVGGSFTVDLSALSSDQERRDGSLRKRYLESARFPLAHFVITGVSGLPDRYTIGERVDFRMTGEMTIREITRETTFDVRAALTADTLSGSASTVLKMTDFGIEPPDILGLLRVKDDVTVGVEFSAARR